MHGRTTFSVAHRLSTLRNADLILVLDKGRCVAAGSHDALLRTSRLYRDLWEAQHVSTLNRRGPRHDPHPRRSGWTAAQQADSRHDLVLGHPGR